MNEKFLFVQNKCLFATFPDAQKWRKFQGTIPLWLYYVDVVLCMPGMLTDSSGGVCHSNTDLRKKIDKNYS